MATRGIRAPAVVEIQVAGVSAVEAAAFAVVKVGVGSATAVATQIIERNIRALPTRSPQTSDGCGLP